MTSPRKTCTKCGETKLLAEFSRDATKSRDGRRSSCRRCDSARAAVYRAANLEKCRAAVRAWIAANPEKNCAYSKASYQRSRSTPRGYLSYTYLRMKERVKIDGAEARRRPGNSWEGKELLPREKFLEWALNDAQFQRLFKRWTEAGRPHKLSPSIERLDSQRGYTLDNMEWLTHSANSKLAQIPGKVARDAPLRKVLGLC